jgi:methenyltetrahydromethanopterin cyclohydrolase
MISVNQNATKIFDLLVTNQEVQKLGLTELTNGTRVLDAGIAVDGSFLAGKYFAEICLGGLGSVTLTSMDFGAFWFPGVAVSTDQPLLACIASQYAGWKISSGSYFAMGSGPARALARVEDIFARLSYQDQGEAAVIALEGRKLPPAEVAEKIAAKCGVQGGNLRVIIAPTASLAGSVQVSARVVETGLHKMMALGFDLEKVVAGFGTAPVAPVAADDVRAIGKTNDCVLYGGKVYYTVRALDEEIDQIIARIPSSASKDYGRPFFQLFKQYNYDFYQIDPLLFSPAEVIINNLSTGRVFRAGQINGDILRESLLEENNKC